MANKLRVRVQGADRLAKRLEAVAKSLRPELVPVIDGEAKALLDLAQQNVPVDSGELKASGGTHTAMVKGEIQSTLEYTSPHAVFVHEGINHGKRTSTGFGFKWLQRAADEYVPTFRRNVLKKVRELVKKGVK